MKSLTLLTHRQETSNKWWHRLVNVCVIGSTIFCLIIGLVLTFSDFRDREESPVDNFVPRTTLTLEKIQAMDAISGWKTTAELADGTFVLNGQPASRADEIRYIGEKAQEAKQNNKTQAYHNLLIGLLWTLGIAACWFIFWDWIVYRTLLYVIFGKKSNSV